jgi:hypothetical protein
MPEADSKTSVLPPLQQGAPILPAFKILVISCCVDGISFAISDFNLNVGGGQK